MTLAMLVRLINCRVIIIITSLIKHIYLSIHHKEISNKICQQIFNHKAGTFLDLEYHLNDKNDYLFNLLKHITYICVTCNIGRQIEELKIYSKISTNKPGPNPITQEWPNFNSNSLCASTLSSELKWSNKIYTEVTKLHEKLITQHIWLIERLQDRECWRQKSIGRQEENRKKDTGVKEDFTCYNVVVVVVVVVVV